VWWNLPSSGLLVVVDPLSEAIASPFPIGRSLPSRNIGGFTLALIIGIAGICAVAADRHPARARAAVEAVLHQDDLRDLHRVHPGRAADHAALRRLECCSTTSCRRAPPSTSILRVVIMVTLFASAYMAEVIRGGLAALPSGQYEAADSLGLDYWKSMRLIILPQALKISIPGIVNTFIGLFKDTTLVSVIGLLDPVGLIAPIRATTRTGTASSGSSTASSRDLLPVLLRHVALLDVSRAQARGPTVAELRGPAMTEHRPSAEELKPDRSAAHAVSDEVAIQITGMNKWYGEFHVLRDINLTVNRGERIVVCGPSGSGKSTLIRCINRLEEHQKGTSSSTGSSSPHDLKNIDKIRAEVGMVFQHFNLFPHLTILENCTLAPIWVRKTPRKEAEEIAMHFLDKVKIPEQAAQVSRPALGRPAAARRHRARALHEAAHHAVRRADLRPRPRDDQGGARHHDLARRGGHDDDLRHPRDGLRPLGREPGDLHGPGPDRRAERAGGVLLNPQSDRTKLFLSQILGH
jgi:general L-amino acid transport system ATP-binding protein